jgi:hypothetical protein
LRQKAITGAKATTRVRFFWRQDEQGNIRVYGVHTGEGTPYEGVRTANMVWNSEHNRYEFTPAHGADGPLITWTPEKPEGSDLPSHTGSDIKPIDQATILVTPIPDGRDEYTTPPSRCRMNAILTITFWCSLRTPELSRFIFISKPRGMNQVWQQGRVRHYQV